MSVAEISKSLGMKYNVSIRVIDETSNKVVQEHIGHNAATNTLITGIGHYLKGDGILNQGPEMLSTYIPRYISLGTMGLFNQEEDEFGYPAGIGPGPGPEDSRFQMYMQQSPGYGADGFSPAANNDRKYLGLGPTYDNRPDRNHTIDCELISKSVLRSEISYRDLIPEPLSETPHTIDVVFSAMISTGALAKFREPGKDYLFITEAGLWSRRPWSNSLDNGLLAGYRIAPTDRTYWTMETQEQRDELKKQIIRVGINQIVQVVWKIQLGAIEQLVGLDKIYDITRYDELTWEKWE